MSAASEYIRRIPMKRFGMLAVLVVILAALTPVRIDRQLLQEAAASGYCQATVYNPLYMYNNIVEYGGKAYNCIAGPTYRIQAWLKFNGAYIDWTGWVQFTSSSKEVKRSAQFCSTRGAGNYQTYLEIWRWSSIAGWVRTDYLSSAITRPCG
jgi:hypothetical protein